MNKKYIKFKLIEEKPKTNVYEIINHKDEVLGRVYYYNGWRQYIYEYKGMMWALGCLQDLCKFLEGLKKDKKLEVLE